MSMLEKNCSEFLEVLASKAPVPGGGGAAAFGGALGMALSNMVGNLTVGKKKYADVEDEVKVLVEQGDQIIADLKALVDQDAEVFAPLSKAYGIPKDDPSREEVMEKCLKEACAVPMEIMRKSFEGLKNVERMAQIGSKLVISDAGCSALFLKAALMAGGLNVTINIGSIKHEEYVNAAKEEMNRLMAEGCKIADETYQLVVTKL